MTVRLGADIGGTFTDLVLDHPGGVASAKVLTDHAAPEAAILRGIAEVCARAGVSPDAIGQVIHGTTLVTNALIERRGARVAFVTTQGFRDVIEMRSENRFEQYDLNLELPKPLVPREDRMVLPERIGPGGEVLLPLDPEAAQAMAARIADGGYGAVAVGLMHAYANDAHERMMADALARVAPGLAVSPSSVVSPRMRELPRFNTVIANAYVQPLVSSYLGRFVAALRAQGIGAQVFLMHSGGGLISVETAMAEPVRLLESGPAGGAIFAAGFAAAHGIAAGLSFDMGGTTAKICLVEEARPKTTDSFEIARSYRFKKGSGMLVSTPGGRNGGDRRGRRLHCHQRRDGAAAGRSTLGRVGARTGGLSARRHGAHGHRCQSGAGAARPGELRRRRDPPVGAPGRSGPWRPGPKSKHWRWTTRPLALPKWLMRTWPMPRACTRWKTGGISATSP